MHRLWYDLRSQSMFEPGLREAVTLIDRTLEEMIWRVVSRYRRTRRPGSPAQRPRGLRACWTAFSSRLCSATLAGRADALDELCQQVRDVMPLMLSA